MFCLCIIISPSVLFLHHYLGLCHVPTYLLVKNYSAATDVIFTANCLMESHPTELHTPDLFIYLWANIIVQFPVKSNLFLVQAPAMDQVNNK
jgi:hypothetical protein